jgi:polyvinyl alcohol dehydrogenase (cytochrome)
MRALALRGCVLAALLGGAAHAEETPLPPEKNLCATHADPVALGTALWNGWGRDLDNSRYQPEPALRAGDVPKLKLKWAFGYATSGGNPRFGQPTIVDGRVFVTSSAGRVYSLDARTGCLYWNFDAPVGSRSAVTIAELGESRRAAVPKKLRQKVKRTLAHLDIIKAPAAVTYGDDSGAVVALDAQKGTLLWRTAVDTHPLAHIIAAPAFYEDRLYVSVGSTEEAAAQTPNYPCCTFRGSVAALDVQSGKLLWKSYSVLEAPQPTRRAANGVQEFAPAGAAISDAPTLDPKREVLYVATGASTTSIEQSLTDAVAAFNLEDGKLRWVKQLTRTGELALSSFLSSPVLRTLGTGNQVLIAGQKSGVVYGLDPDHGGEILWQTPLGRPSGSGPPTGGVNWGLAADHRNVYAALTGSLLQPATGEGSLTALDLKTGAPRWVAAAPPCAPAEPACLRGQTQAVSVIPGIAFSGSLDGHLRAYSTIEGKVLWDFDTAKPFQTVNGIPAQGGALDFSGATIVNGAVYVNAGNALLVFSVDGQ